MLIQIAEVQTNGLNNWLTINTDISFDNLVRVFESVSQLLQQIKHSA